MILGIGIDIIEISRISSAIKSQRFLSRVYTPDEIMRSQKRGKQLSSTLAGIFAAKEAFVKAVGTGMIGGNWQDIEIKKRDTGEPYIVLYGYWADLIEVKSIKNIFLSISHSKDNAIAQVVLEG